MRYAIAKADAVKGRVVTSFDRLSTSQVRVSDTIEAHRFRDADTYEVRQVIDGHTVYVEQFATRLGAADVYAFLRSRARRSLHAYESDTKPEQDERVAV